MDVETKHQVEQVEPLPLPQAKKPRRSSKNKTPTRSKMVTGYIIYASEIRKEIISKHKDLSFGEISKIVGDEWKKLAQETKVAYEKRAQEQNVKFRIEFAALEQQAGLVKLANAAAAHAGSALKDNKQQEVQQNLHQNQNQHPDQPLVNFSSQQQHEHQALAVYHQQQLLQQQSTSVNPDFQHIQHTQLHNQSPYNIEDLRSVQHHNHQQGEQQQQMQDIMANFQQQQQQQNSAPVSSELQNQAQQFAQSHLHHQSPYHVEDLRSNQHNHQQQEQQHQPFMQQSQQPFPTMVQYCNNPACCSTNNARYQPYPYPYSPPTRPATPLSLQQQSISSHIVYRRPIVEKHRPKDVSTQTDPIKWVEKTENEFNVDDKKPLKFSQKFLDHMNSNSSETEGDSNNNISDDASASATEAASH